MSRMITLNNFSKEHYDIILIGSADELKKKSNIGDLLLLHGNAYEIKKIGRNDKTYELCALLININNPKDRAVRSLNYLAKELPHLIKKKNKIIESIENKILYIIRGVPGSGKSTLAKTLTKNVVEADQFMYEDGEYKWKPEKLHMAHKKCQETVEQYMQEGRDKIAVANTFIKLKDIKPYIDLAKQYDYKIVIKECNGGFQSIHNVPQETLDKMKSKFQPYIKESVEYIEGIEVLINPTKQELNGFMKKNKVYRVLLTDNDMAIWTADCSLCHLDVEGEYPEFNNSEHLFALNGNLFFVDYDMQPEEIEDFYFEDAEKLDNLPIVKEYFPHSQMKKALEMMKKGISVFNTPSKWYSWLNESVEEKIIAYHGSQHKKFNFRDDKVLYLTTNKNKAISYAKREWDEGLIEGEVPVVYTFEVSVKNPYECHTENEFQSEFCDVNMNEEGGKEDLIEKGYDSIKYQDLIGVFSSSQFKLIDTEVLPPSLDYYYPKDTKYGDEDINDYYYDEEEMKESKQLTESILYDDLAYNDWNEKYEQLTVIANPSIDWLRNQLNRDDCYGFRFLHNTERNKLYVWDCKQPWMHQQVFDMVDMDWGKPGTNVIGIFEPEGVAVWEELAEDGEASSSIKLAKKLDGEFFKQLYPDGYQITTCC